METRKERSRRQDTVKVNAPRAHTHNTPVRRNVAECVSLDIVIFVDIANFDNLRPFSSDNSETIAFAFAYPGRESPSDPRDIMKENENQPVVAVTCFFCWCEKKDILYV